jgi:hypothetical protein
MIPHQGGEDMGFWSTFLAGIASGIVVAVLAVIIRYYFKHSGNESTLKLTKRTLGVIIFGIIMLATVGSMVSLALSGQEIHQTLYVVFFISAMWFYFLVL